MHTDDFWHLIDDARTGAVDDEDHSDALVRLLAQLAPGEIIAFQRRYREYKALSCTEPLWAAACLVNEEADDEGFDRFRDWLIGQGRDRFEAALADPDSLATATWDAQSIEDAENLAYAAPDAYRQLTGGELFLPDVALERAFTGRAWGPQDLPRLLPRLATRVGRTV
ncbi:DUF4240 domain-containing protein [Kitasatospora azatica]|uniref:DUF4240 domain-containing protein n=1 Tax=Kitasatospora azatica TaxID=58347 RepID=UPI00068D3A76|nr:DUF4240 domain-containing protein [Kitasatospora azatica]